MLIPVELHVMQIEQTNFEMFSYFIKLSGKTERSDKVIQSFKLETVVQKYCSPDWNINSLMNVRNYRYVCIFMLIDLLMI